MAQSEIRLQGHSEFDFDLDSVKTVIRGEGREVAKIARRLISRNAVSGAGEFAGKQSGFMRRSLKTRLLSKGLAIVITHKMPAGAVKYPFLLVHGIDKNNVKPLADHIAEAMKRRKSQTTQALRSALRKNTIKPTGSVKVGV